MAIICLLIIAFLFWALLGDKISKAFKLIVAISLIGVIIYIAFSLPQISIPLILALFLLGFYSSRKDKIEIKKWRAQPCEVITEYQLDDLIKPIILEIKIKDQNKNDYCFDEADMPYGRMTAFLNYFGYDRNTSAYYFSPVASKKSDELREYGLAVIPDGVLISSQVYDSSAEDGYKRNDIVYPFSGLISVTQDKKTMSLKYVKKDQDSYEWIKLPIENLSIEPSAISYLFEQIIKNNVAEALYKGKVISSDEIQQKIDDAEEKQIKDAFVKDTAKMTDTVGVISGASSRQVFYDENKNLLNSERGSGYAAEYGNNTIDRLVGRKVENLAQQLDETNRQVKHGADRQVNGVQIQTKYYKTPNESIGAAFQNKQAIYLNEDGSMMQIEVPRDQYNQACQLMQKRIDSGQVPGAQKGDDPRKYVRKGIFTYNGAWNVAAAGTIESLSVDFASGVIASVAPGGISMVIVFAIAIWNGQDPKEAAKVSLITGVKVIGKGALIYTLTQQITRKNIAIPFTQDFLKSGNSSGKLIAKGAKTVTNPAFTISNNIANSINTSTIAKTSFGKSLKLDQVNGRAVTSSAVTAIVVFGPDLCRAASGRISTKQLFKNSAVGAAGIGGAVIGNAIVPVLGGMVGGMVTSFVAKNVLDAFVEDDAKEMFQILKEEFLDAVMETALLESEFELVLNQTLTNDQLSKMLQKMYMSREYRAYAREAIVKVAITNVIQMRTHVTNETVYEGFTDYTVSVA